MQPPDPSQVPFASRVVIAACSALLALGIALTIRNQRRDRRERRARFSARAQLTNEELLRSLGEGGPSPSMLLDAWMRLGRELGLDPRRLRVDDELANLADAQTGRFFKASLRGRWWIPGAKEDAHFRVFGDAVRFAARGQAYREAHGWPRHAPARTLLGIALIALGEWLSLRWIWSLLLPLGGIALLLETPPAPLPAVKWTARAADLLGWIFHGAFRSLVYCTGAWLLARDVSWAPLHPWLPLTFAIATAMPLPLLLNQRRLLESPARQAAVLAGYLAAGIGVLALFAI